MFTRRVKKQSSIVSVSVVCFRWKKRFFHLCVRPPSPSTESQVLLLLFVWKLEARETGVLSDVLLARGSVLYSSSHSGGLASGAIWLSSTLRRYWCLAMKYCMCWDAARAPAARRRRETVIILDDAHPESHRL